MSSEKDSAARSGVPAVDIDPGGKPRRGGDPAHSIDSRALAALTQRTVQRYRTRYREHGVSARSLGWGSKDDQTTRFATALRLADFADKTVLDYGCGFADLYGFLQEVGQMPRAFVGIDVNPDFITVARDRYPDAEFHVNDLAAESAESWDADIVVMLGLLNYRDEEIDNAALARRQLEMAFRWTRQTLICDFLSSVPTPNYPREDWVNYYEPSQVLEWGLSLTPRVALIHDHPPIPQREIMLALHRPLGLGAR